MTPCQRCVAFRPVAAQGYDLAAKQFAEALGPDSDMVRTALSNAATVLIKFGHYQEALEVNQRALDQIAHAYGKEHPEYATMLMNRGNTLHKLDRNEEAAALHREVIALREKASTAGGGGGGGLNKGVRKAFEK